MTYRRHTPDPHIHDRNRGQRLPSMLGAESFARLARVAQKVAPPHEKQAQGDERWLCSDCTQVAVHDDASFLDYSHNEEDAAARLAEIKAGLARLGPDLTQNIFGEGGEEDFSSSPCDSCGSKLAGTRYRFEIIKGPNAMAPTAMKRFASLAAVTAAGYQALGGGFYREAAQKSAHSIWELRGAQEGEGYVLVRKREERAADLALADTAGRGTAAAVDAGIVRQARVASETWTEVGPLDGAITESMARTLFVDAWASAMEERGETSGWAGQDLMNLAPETSAEAKAAAAKLAAEFVSLNGKSLTTLLEDAAAADGGAALNASYVEEFGHNLAMQAVGHGVSWFDDHAKFPIQFPRSENNVFVDVDEDEEHEAMAPRAGMKVRVVRHGAIADAVIVVMKPEVGAAELLFGDGAQEDVPVDMILDLTSVGGSSMDPDGAAPIVIGSDDVMESDPFEVEAAAERVIEDVDHLMDIGQKLIPRGRDRAMQLAHAQGHKACELCGRAIKNFQTASKVVGAWVGPECTQKLQAAGYTWSAEPVESDPFPMPHTSAALFAAGARRIAMLKRSVDFSSGFRPGSVVETTRAFRPFYHQGIEVPAGEEFTVEGFHTPKDDPMFGFNDLGKSVPNGTDFQNLRLRLMHSGGGSLVVTMNEFAQDFELARGQESEPEYGDLPSVEETLQSRAPTVRAPGQTVVDRMPTTDELAPTYVGFTDQPTVIRQR